MHLSISLIASGPLHGLMDEVRLWNIARSPGEILANYNRTVAPSTAGLVGYWNFDEASGQTIYDLTTNDNDGLLGATAAVATDDPKRVLSDAPLVPEPGTLGFLIMGGLAMLRRRGK